MFLLFYSDLTVMNSTQNFNILGGRKYFPSASVEIIQSCKNKGRGHVFTA